MMQKPPRDSDESKIASVQPACVLRFDRFLLDAGLVPGGIMLKIPASGKYPSGTMTAPAPFNLRTFFSGDWALSRRIVDQRAGLIGRLSGLAQFRSEGESLIYEENGALQYGAHQGPAHQAHRWHLLGNGQADIYFKDGRFFHHLDLTQNVAAVAHPCAPDQYIGRFRLIDALGWRSIWQITGPRKHMVIANRFRRIDTEASSTATSLLSPMT